MTNISTTDDLHGHADGEAPGVAAVPSATVTAAGLWCRACGADVHGPGDEMALDTASTKTTRVRK